MNRVDLRDALDHPPYVDDDGFTARVMERLPARRARVPARGIVLGFALLGCGGAYVASGDDAIVRVAGALGRQAHLSPIATLACIAVVLAAMLAGIATIAVEE